jgi:hypothetical protein
MKLRGMKIQGLAPERSAKAEIRRLQNPKFPPRFALYREILISNAVDALLSWWQWSRKFDPLVAHNELSADFGFPGRTDHERTPDG